MMETEIVAFDYYDGPTEGLARSVKRIGPCYFKVLAWDDTQDQRLFAVVGVERSEFEIGMAEVGRALRPSDARVRVLCGSADGENDVLDRLVKHCKERIRDSGSLLLGPQVDAPETVLFPIGVSLRSSVVEALSTDSPEDLFDWLPRLS